MELKLVNTWLLFLLLSLSSSIVHAQKTTSSEDDVVSEFLATHDSIENQKTKILRPPQLELNALASSGDAVHDSIQFDRQLKQYDFAAMHQQRSFAWQFYSSIIIFVMVVFIVVMGLVLSYKQFQLTEVQVKSNIKKPKSETTEIKTEETNIEISQTGLKINTGVIGLAILFLSLAFFFLYLKYVYQIEVIDVGK
jgi:cytochrome c-type biogenesis protein CcmH/NrfG